MSVELHGVHRAAHSIVLTEVVQGGGCLEGDAAGEQPLDGVAADAGVVGGGEIGEAVHAYLAFAVDKYVAAAGAGAGE